MKNNAKMDENPRGITAGKFVAPFTVILGTLMILIILLVL